MSKAKELIFQPAAMTDLDEIFDYTFDHWGLERAEKYIRMIDGRCRDLASGRRSGFDASVIRTGYRKLAAGSHMIFYLSDADRLYVIRVLHQSRDYPQHLT